MKDASKKILSTLSSRGYRVTKAREEIIEALAAQTQPVTIKTLAEMVSSDHVSVYRTVSVLVEEGLIEEVKIQGGVSHYMIMHDHTLTHHHHIICTNCNLVAHIPCNPESIQEKIPQDFKKVFSHELTLYGVCKKCA